MKSRTFKYVLKSSGKRYPPIIIEAIKRLIEADRLAREEHALEMFYQQAMTEPLECLEEDESENPE